MKRLIASVLLLVSGLFATSQLRAADVYVSAYVSLRAGPYIGYPRLAVLNPGVSLVLYGCLDDWSWCDVGYLGDRGWVSANYLSIYYDDRRVLLPDYAVRIGVPVVVFSLPVYWSAHYRNRPWYPERHRWERLEREQRTRRVLRPAVPPPPGLRSPQPDRRGISPQPPARVRPAPLPDRKVPRKRADHGGGGGGSGGT